MIVVVELYSRKLFTSCKSNKIITLYTNIISCAIVSLLDL